MAPRQESWLSLLPCDPRPTLLGSEEPFARFVAMTEVLGIAEDDAEVRAVRKLVITDPRVRGLVDRLPAWESGFAYGGHNSPAFPPNILRILHGMGVRAGDFSRIDRMLDEMLVHQAEDGRLLSPGGATGRRDGKQVWASLPCDHFAILEVLLLYGRHGEHSVQRAIERICDTFADSTQGPGWLCIPDPVVKWRGPGRKNDVCLQVTIEALRVMGMVGERQRPTGIGHAARTVLGAWRDRHEHKPYMFGHGSRFVSGKWPPTWYDATAVLQALALYPSVWKGRSARAQDRESIKEIVAAVATTFGPDGMITPRSCYKGFEAYSFGQKKKPSAWATARVCGVLRACSP